MKRLHNKVVIITGATGGLGQTVTAEFSNAGATIVVAEHHPSKKLPDGVQSVTADVTQESDVQQLVTEVTNKTGRIDCLINLVGGFAMGRLSETNASDCRFEPCQGGFGSVSPIGRVPHTNLFVFPGRCQPLSVCAQREVVHDGSVVRRKLLLAVRGLKTTDGAVLRG